MTILIISSTLVTPTLFSRAQVASTQGMSHYATIIAVVVIGGLVGSVAKRDIPKVSLRGAGASFPSRVYQSWLVLYAAYRKSFVSLNLAYDAAGSGSGKAMVKGETGKYIDYASSDSLLSDADHEQHPDLKMFPTMAG